MNMRTTLGIIVAFGVGAAAAIYWSHHYISPVLTSTAPDGSRYYGPLVDGKRHGIGKVEWDSGSRYEGGFENGLFSGHGVIITGNGNRYEGQFKTGLMSGSGKATYFDGSRYEGEFQADKLHGKGKFVNSEGAIYEGDFSNDVFTGQGIYTLLDKSRFEGQFEKWQAQGPGKYIDAGGNVYEGRFDKGVLNGPGRYIGKDGSVYEGNFAQWVYHSQGRLKLSNGDVYTGEFSHGLYHGTGTLQYAKPQGDGRTQDTGPWAYGALSGEDRESRGLANVERALYNQQKLLNEAVQELQASDPRNIDLYFLAVAGDGTQEVFRREVEFVRAQFDRDYGTQGRSMVLINSRTSVDRTPLATSTSIRTAIDGIAQRMDKENDILFLYLTSHGSRKYKFSLQQESMDFADLGAAELAELLKGSGIRNKVVVVSACYSGGFIDHLKNDHTMVITAARHDRTSFGCADENDFTYFGRAFFKEALPQSESFSAAFNTAASLVDEWERTQAADSANKEDANEKFPHSLPQIHHPAAIEAQLKRWRTSLRREVVLQTP